MPYSYLTLAQMRSQLASRLDDPNMLFWVSAELNGYILEALRTFQACANYWRTRGTFSLIPNVPFYDINPTLVDALSNAILLPTITDTQLVTSMLYSLVEPPTLPYTGSSQFNLTTITNALQNRRNQFLVETGVVLTESILNFAPDLVGRIDIADNVIDVRRVAWQDAGISDLNYIPLWPSDEFASTAFNPGWNLNATSPNSYSVIGSPPLTVQLMPIPDVNSLLDFLTVNNPGNLDPTTGILMNVPDNWAWVLRWGALADLLGQDGEPRDDARSQYCESRYRQGCELARTLPTVINGAINEQQVFVQSVADLDAFMPAWEATIGAPTQLGLSGQNMLCAAPVPDAVNPYSVRLDVVSNAPVPALDTDFIQVGRETLDVLLDYSQHLAAFKMGGTDFFNSQYLYQRFMQHCGLYNDRLTATSVYKDAMLELAHKETDLRPRRETDVTT